MGVYLILEWRYGPSPQRSVPLMFGRPSVRLLAAIAMIAELRLQTFSHDGSTSRRCGDPGRLRASLTSRYYDTLHLESVRQLLQSLLRITTIMLPIPPTCNRRRKRPHRTVPVSPAHWTSARTLIFAQTQNVEQSREAESVCALLLPTASRVMVARLRHFSVSAALLPFTYSFFTE